MKISESMLSRLTSQHLSMGEIVSSISATRINLHPAFGKWSIHDNIAHLARYNVVFQERLITILEQDAPKFPRYNADDDPAFPVWQQKSTTELLQSVSIERENILDKATKYSISELKRIGLHPKFGRLTVVEWLEFYLLHEAHHIFTIFKLKNDVDLVAIA
ncbi:hypothetical protein BH11BAC1_BH11BAC1_21880 [soil metagenome]